MDVFIRWLLLSFLFGITACTPSSNESISDTDSVVSTYQANIFNQGDQLKVRYDLPDFFSELVFSNHDTQQRQVAWKVADAGFEFDGEKVWRKNGNKFRQVTFEMFRDSQFFNRRYVAIDDIAPMAWSLFLPAFAVNKQDTVLTFQSGDSLIVRIGANSHELDEPYLLGEKNMMSYFGPPDYVRKGDAIIIAGPDIPKWLINEVSTKVSQTMKVLESGFKVTPVNKPTLYLTTGPNKNGTSTKAGQLHEAVMTFRYRGFDFSNVDQSLTDGISNTSAHEAAHLWIGGIFSNNRNDKEPWMHEGGAEYIADRARNSSDEIKAEFEQRLNNCLRRIDSRLLDGSEGSVQGLLVYDCGYVLHAAAESATLKNSDANILGVWQHMIANLKDGNKSYFPSDFLNAVVHLSDSNFENFSHPFLKGGTDTRWQELPFLAQKIGIHLKPSLDNRLVDTQLLTGIWLMPLLAKNCEGSHGFYNNDDAKILDVDNCNAPFESGLELISINNISLLNDAHIASNKVREICAEKGQLILGLKDGKKLPPVSCELKIPPLPPYYNVTVFPELPSLLNE